MFVRQIECRDGSFSNELRIENFRDKNVGFLKHLFSDSNIRRPFSD